MVTVAKAMLKARMLEYFRRVEQTGEDLVVTSHRKPVLRVSRFSVKRPVAVVFSDVRGKAVLAEDELLKQETAEWGGAI